MICALTVRALKPGTFDQFREAFTGDMEPGDPPPGWQRFSMVRNAERPDEVVCFGFFDGTVEDVRRAAGEQGYAEQQAAIAPFVASVGADGLYEVVEDSGAARA
jgi:heme-degrading monooxygenase HmoA